MYYGTTNVQLDSSRLPKTLNIPVFETADCYVVIVVFNAAADFGEGFVQVVG
jgi:hypothetical protein